MRSLEDLNVQYTKIITTLNVLHSYERKIADVQNHADKSMFQKVLATVEYLLELRNTIDFSEHVQAKDTINVGVLYVNCQNAIQRYKMMLLQSSSSAQSSMSDVTKKLTIAQNKFDEHKSMYAEKYLVSLDSEAAINHALASCLTAIITTMENQTEQLRREAKELAGRIQTVALNLSDEVRYPDSLPEKILVARYSADYNTMPILKDIGAEDFNQNVSINIRNQGNILLKTDLLSMDEEVIDNYVLAYIFRILESFPIGSVNVHIFARNMGFLYRRLYNAFQTEQSGDGTKKAIQLHGKLDDLTALRDIVCEDVFKRTSITNPDLFSIYDNDDTEPFHFIILRDGLVDGSGYVSPDILDTISALTKPSDTGHICGFRFLVVDNTGSYEKNLSDGAMHRVQNIRKNCELNISIYDQKTFVHDQEAEVLHISENLDVFVQSRARDYAELLNSKEQNIVSLEDVAVPSVADVPGAIMYFPVGKSGVDVIELPLSCKDESGTIAGQCIGYMAIGQSGSGKSSFFHSLILNGCLKYSPDDLQFWLLDFKHGGASSKYSKSGLPHIKLIAEDNKVDDALCLFQMVLDEMEERIKTFNDNSVDDIVDYNRIANERGLYPYPRIIIAIDEIQEIFRDENASELHKQISSISTRMRSTGMHFVMVAQNLSEGKSYMLKDAFLPSASGRICFRVAPDIPRDSGFDDDFIQRKEEISGLKTGEAYISYGKGTISKIKMAYVSPQDMNERYFKDIQRRYPEYTNSRPLVIGTKKRLTIYSPLNGEEDSYLTALSGIKPHTRNYTAIIGEDSYRFSPITLRFSQRENSSVLLLGDDKQIASSLCASVAVSLIKQRVELHLINADLYKDYDDVPHAFMLVCQNIRGKSAGIYNHKPSELKDVVSDIYSVYLERQNKVQEAEDEAPDFEPVFLLVNDLLGITSFKDNISIETEENNFTDDGKSGFDFTIDFQSLSAQSGQFSEDIQSIMTTLLRTGWRYNIHAILAVKSSPSEWRHSHVASELNQIVLFNKTEYSAQFDHSYFLKEMLQNISDGRNETMAVWRYRGKYSKIRPIIYDLSNQEEKRGIEALILGAYDEKIIRKY